ncbi:type II secretion system protein [Paraburkholderia sp. MMS20-SJTN17]|uniref:Type II secretion system protein n=1 Tax=Paraburkholderia translucens TaxID=2886945 RepID=A0ABS8K7L8_9BURK|nr:type II secretion system protein [Paraburkholderia sp. MMS20-SJTN17]MCC8400738.1 type II secretion system protein [Paraburkholderia sp. MMS20-SJTN17]
MTIAGSRIRCVKRMAIRSTRERGLVMLTLLIALLLLSIALMGALDVWSLQRKREAELQLLFVGDQYRLAILRYYRAGRALPASIDDLLNDTRVPVPLHHLRRAYADPVTGQNDWVLIYQAGRIGGLHSSSTDVPIKIARFPQQYENFEGQQSYADWQFVYLPPVHHNTSSMNGASRPAKPGSLNAPFDPMNNGLPSFTPRSLDTSR